MLPQAVRTPLETVGPEVEMVDSLLHMWRDERQRAGDCPLPPPSPPRTPKPLCAAVEAVRAELQVRRGLGCRSGVGHDLISLTCLSVCSSMAWNLYGCCGISTI